MKMSEENFYMANLFAGLLGTIVENKTLEDALNDVGLSESFVLNQWIAPQSSSIANDYVKELIAEQFGKISRDESSSLYLVKKVFCKPAEFEKMAEAVLGQDTDKFNVLRLIGSNPKLMKYKQENHGLEEYLVSGKNQLDALRKTSGEDPIFHYAATYFDENEARKFDQLFVDAIYNHTTSF
jgi:hypothetical protein